MVNGLWKIAGFIMIVALLIIFPLLKTLESEDHITQLHVTNLVSDFVDSVRMRGGLSPALYSTFVQQLESTGHHYEISLVHEITLYVPNPDEPTGFLIVHERVSSEEIKSKLLEKAGHTSSALTYAMKSGDYFACDVKVIDKTRAQVLQEALLGTRTDYRRIYARFGGVISYAAR